MTQFITISEHLGADVHEMPEDVTAADIAAHDGDELEAFKEFWGYNEADSIFSAEDARAMALHILEYTGGLRILSKLLRVVTYMGEAVSSGNLETATSEWEHHVAPALQVVRELGITNEEER